MSIKAAVPVAAPVSEPPAAAMPASPGRPASARSVPEGLDAVDAAGGHNRSAPWESADDLQNSLEGRSCASSGHGTALLNNSALQKFDADVIGLEHANSVFDDIVRSTEQQELTDLEEEDAMLRDLSEAAGDCTPHQPSTEVVGGRSSASGVSVDSSTKNNGRRREWNEVANYADLAAAEGLLEYGEDEWKVHALGIDRRGAPRVAGIVPQKGKALELEMVAAPGGGVKRSSSIEVPAPQSVADAHGGYGWIDGGASDENTTLLTMSQESTGDGNEVPLWRYAWEMVTNFTDNDTVRGKQARLTLWEFLEHFDFFNDFLFIGRVGTTTFMTNTNTLESQNSVNMGKIAMVCLTCIWITSGIAYAMRHIIMYHRIEGDNMWLFCPIVVFQKIRTVGETSPEALYMFERVFWTYQLVMRLVEDIPQVICSAVFLATFGSDFYTYFMISYSCMLMLLTSYRMGVMYPIFGTLSLILSREPPVDSPVLTEAATTTKNFSGFMFIIFGMWLLADIICLFFAKGLWFITFCVLATVAGCLACFFLTYWGYLLKQSTGVGGLEEFHKNFEMLGTPRRSDSSAGPVHVSL